MPDLKDALDLLDTGQWVALDYVSFDAKRGTAGSIIRIKRCRLATASSAAPGAQARKLATPAATEHKDPNHFEHATRNVRLASGSIRKLHIRLIFSINNKKLI